MNAELIALAQRIEQARDLQDVFGTLSGQPDEQLRAARLIFRRLSKVIHPDRYPLPDDQQIAQRTMAQLNGLWAEARRRIRSGSYTDQAAAAATIRIISRKRAYDIGMLISMGEVCQRYACHFDLNGAARSGIFKIARTPNDNDLVRIEAKVLRHMRADKNFTRLFPFVPEVFDSFLYDDRRTAPRQANIISRIENVYSLEEVHAQYPRGVDPKHVAWLWRKLLIALGLAHARGVIHGAVLPSHILIEPDQHGLILDNWVYALPEPIERDAHLTAIVSAYEVWYPPEVFARQPPAPSLDIFMGTRCMVYLLGGDPITGDVPTTVPKAIASFFRGCLLPAPDHRPQQAWNLLNEFTELIERLWGPRIFRPLAMPSLSNRVLTA